jgi:tripartite-type tricarboxylate transporter receptor subunit TctC
MRVSAIVLSAVIALASTAGADDAYPSRQVSLVVPVAAGGGSDTVARMVGRKLAAALGQPVVVENRPGAAENIGIGAVAKAPPDGYTLLLGSNTITINPSLFRNLGYDANRDLLPIGKVSAMPLVIVTGPAAPYATLPELIAYAKQNPGKLSYASPGVGTPHHLAMETLKSAAGLAIQHIPYKGTGPALTDMLAGNIPLLMTTLAPVETSLQSGKLRALATLEPARLSRLADVPAASETLTGFAVGVWHGVFAPAQTAPAITAKLTRVLETVVKDPDLADQLGRVAILPSWAPPAELQAIIRDEQARWAEAIRKAGIQAE